MGSRGVWNSMLTSLGRVFFWWISISVGEDKVGCRKLTVGRSAILGEEKVELEPALAIEGFVEVLGASLILELLF
jgi:hypothetical protein